jgi:hypothetical protein
VRALLGAWIALALLGCSSKPGAEEPAGAQAPPEATVFDPLTGALEKTRQQAETLPQQRKDDLDAAIDGGSP